jgi:hypothetical protein
MKGVNMELTIQEVHTYNNLVNEGKVEPLKFAGMGESEFDSVLLPALDQDGKVYLHDVSDQIKIYPGINTIEKIKKAIDNL